MIGHGQILILIIVVVLVFGASRFPKIMKNLAEGVKVFKKEMKGDKKPAAKKKAVKKSPVRNTKKSK
ncbi:MAG: twin-arginine translocase TatA/TatE family subunit [Alphaproteobacteria bacterium]|nr:twin-arginine translocase TatA/TatE family subunit [Alphaproteobacteria bacterium]